MNLAETIYRKSLDLSPEKAQEVIDFIDFLVQRQKKSEDTQPDQEEDDSDPPLLTYFEEAGLVGCISTDEQLSTTYKEKIDYSFKHGDPS